MSLILSHEVDCIVFNIYDARAGWVIVSVVPDGDNDCIELVEVKASLLPLYTDDKFAELAAAIRAEEAALGWNCSIMKPDGVAYYVAQHKKKLRKLVALED